MNFILEFKSFYKPGDLVLIKYWYNRMVTPVRIVEKKGNKFLVSHDVESSKIRNAPDELIKNSEIISPYRN
jgi:hypothetical protein